MVSLKPHSPSKPSDASHHVTFQIDLPRRELRHKKLVDDTLARHGMKRQNLNPARLERLREEAEGEAEELLDAQVTENGINL